jgi:integrase
MKHTPTPSRHGRPRTGRIESWRDRNGHTRYRARITLLDGTSQRVPVPANTTKEQASKLALEWQTREDASHALHVAKANAEGTADGETTGAWFARYTAARAVKIIDADRNALRWKKYIAPHIAAIPIAALARADIERVRDGLDRAIAAKSLHAKSARNVWCVLTKAMRESVSSKIPGIRCRDTNPCDNVAPPDTGESRARPWLYPREVTQLLGCEAVVIEHRQLFAIAAYSFLRPGELAALKWDSVDFDAGLIHVRKALNWDSGLTKAPKTRNARRALPIHPNLRPLLEAMEGEPNERVWPNLEGWNESRGGQTFRADLITAGIERPSLFSGNEDTLPADFRSLRTTGATWAAISGLDGRTLERRIGHADKLTTDRYVGVAEDVTGGAIGVPFPPLPESLISATLLATKNAKPRFRGAIRSGEGGIRMRRWGSIRGVSRAFATPRMQRVITFRLERTRRTRWSPLKSHLPSTAAIDR